MGRLRGWTILVPHRNYSFLGQLQLQLQLQPQLQHSAKSTSHPDLFFITVIGTYNLKYSTIHSSFDHDFINRMIAADHDLENHDQTLIQLCENVGIYSLL
jgi:hypothetical protein